MEENLLKAFALTLFAGLATGIGSLMALLMKRTNVRMLSFSLGLSAGVMLYVSFVEILVKGLANLAAVYGEIRGTWFGLFAFFGGMTGMMVLDLLVPSPENPHSFHSIEEMNDKSQRDNHLLRMGMFTALAIGIHNFPEGLATFTAALYDPRIGVSIAVAIAIHNIPEGISVSVPIFFATGSRKKAFWWSFLSGISEPVGAIVGYSLLRPFLTAGTFGFLFAFVAGVMVYVSLDELLPAAREYDSGHVAIVGVISGMIVMALSLVLFM